jgi:hypothetical protein
MDCTVRSRTCRGTATAESAYGKEPTSILRKLIITALAVGAVIAAPSAALAADAPPAHPVSAAVAKIQQVPCRSWTFNVHYGTGREICFEGTGGLTFKPPIQNVHEITTGENAGYFWVDLAGGIQRVPFHPHETLLEAHAELLALRIVRT